MSEKHQLFAFALKKGEYYVELAESHLKSNEPKKAKELLMQAATWFEKGGDPEMAKLCREMAAKL